MRIEEPEEKEEFEDAGNNDFFGGALSDLLNFDPEP